MDVPFTDLRMACAVAYPPCKDEVVLVMWQGAQVFCAHPTKWQVDLSEKDVYAFLYAVLRVVPGGNRVFPGAGHYLARGSFSVRAGLIAPS